MSTWRDEQRGRFPGWLGDVAVWSYRHAGLVVLLAAVSVLVAAWSARTLSVDTDLTHLLPRSFESVQNLERLERHSRGVGYVSLVLSGGGPEERRALADELVPAIEALSSIRYVDHRRPTAWFADRALYYLDVEQLEQINGRITERREWEVRKRSPLYDLGLEPLGEAPSLSFDELRGKERQFVERLGLRGAALEASPYLEGDGILVLLARPSQRASELGFTDRVVGDVRAAVDRVLARQPEARRRVVVRLSGRYAKKAEQRQQIERDLRWASLFALLAMVGYLALHFRRLSAILLVLLPLGVGVGWTFGLAAALYGSLNLLTGFIGAVLLGIGVDHGIHLLSRVEEERLTVRSRRYALRRSFATTGRAVLAAALTTVLAFVGVAFSEFRAFREFGVVAAAGIVFVVMAYATLLPALFRLLCPGRLPTGAKPRLARGVARWAPVTGWLCLLFGLAAFSCASRLRFDYDFASLEDAGLPAFQLDQRVNELLGRSQTPLLVAATSPEHERAIAALLRDRLAAEGEASAVQGVLALADFVPDGAADKQAVLQQIGEQLRDTKDEWLDAAQRGERRRLLTLSQAGPFGRDDLPVEVRRQFQSADARVSYVLVFPRVSLSDGAAVRRLADELRSVEGPGGTRLEVAGEAMVLADVLAMVTSEGPVIMGVTMILVLLSLLFLVGPALVVPCAGVAAATLAATAGLMPLFGLELNYLDIVMVPILFGMSVDGAVHVLVRYRETPDVDAVSGEAGRAVAGAILTTALGFSAFTVAHHPGLASLGKLAVLGLCVNALVCLVALPSALGLVEVGRRLNHQGGFTRLVVTLGHAGDAPYAGGTLGALVAVPLALWAQRLGVFAKALVVAGVLVVALVAVERYLKQTSEKDPSEVVIDELAGCLIALLLVPEGVGWAVAAFVLFRILDIAKPWPISYVERRVHGAWGVIGDDLAAGALAGLLVSCVHRLSLVPWL